MLRVEGADAPQPAEERGVARSSGQDGAIGAAESAGYSLLNSLVIAARHHDVQLAVTQLIHDHLLQPREVSWSKLATLARASGLRAVSTRLTWNDIVHLGKAVPAIVRLSNGYAMVVLSGDARGRTEFVMVQDPMAVADTPLRLDEARFCEGWTGEVLLLKRSYAIEDEAQPFGFRSIFGKLLQHPRIVRDIIIAGFMCGLLSATPIFFWRLLIDRVLYYDSLDTFTVLCMVMAMLIVFETAYAWLRRHLGQNIMRRIEVGLATEIFDKLLNLPVTFFESNQTGKILHDTHEIHKIREFITGHVFGTVLDSLVLIVFLPIMFFFSVFLTLILLGFCAVICVWIILMLPALRQKSAKVQAAEGQKGAFLSETLQGIRTVKSLALDARRRRDWDVLVSRAASYRYDESSVANTIQTVILPLERLMTTGVIAIAVYLAVTTQQQVFVGALVAFMMLSMRVAAPLMQVAASLQEYDEARAAVLTIGRMINQPKEEGRSGMALRPTFAGQIEFVDVRFTYPGSITPALDNVSFIAPRGTIFGIMGRSGSGKTTVTRLLQMLHSEYQGQIKIDGNNLTQIDIDHLRSSIGVVLQDNFLFSGTIAATIGATKPDATLDEIMTAARLAGADEFIERLPAGYRTFIQENSTNLSGGQRQRLAIARALIGNPRILILDEATSALDAESEAIVNANLLSIAKGRTLIIISHRLSSLMAADTILVLERGKVYDIGRHEELLERCDIYSGLWHQQHRHLELSGPANELVPA